jgi:hypothetical protein
MTDDFWITVNFIPAQEQPLFVHLLEGTGTRTEQLVGWLVQHRLGNNPPTEDEERSRVIAGVLEPDIGEVLPINCDSHGFVGIYPAGGSPSPQKIEEIRNLWNEIRRQSADT